MAIPLERFIQQIEETGIIAGDTLKDFIPPKGTSKDAEDLARELVRQKKLTKYQAEEVYRGKGKSLTLGNYLLMEKIGAGGMGQVFKAQHRRMKRIVAIKLLPAAMTKDKEAIARFEREVEAAAKISHPNIVAAFDADCANGVHFLVMELVEGKDLSALVKKNGPFSVGKTIIYILQAAKGLEAAHKKGIVHRDIKPANLLLDSEGTVKILDMGLARLNGEADAPAQAELTSTGTVMGTVDYMAPEQALNTKTADARADIYALGCTLWYLLTGKSTYDGDTLMAKLLAHRDQPIPSLRSASPDIPEQLDAVFHKMVAKKTEDRYQNMTQLIVELERCRQGDDSTVIGRDLVLPPAEPDMMDFLRDLSATQPASAKKTSTVTQSLMKKAAGKTPIGNDKKKLLICGGLLALFILLAGIVVSLKTKDGTLVVTVSEADADVQVLNEAGQVEVTRKGEKGPITIAVDPGKHRLKVTKDGFEFFTQDFSIESGGKQPITAKLVPLEEKPAAPVPALPTESPDRAAAEWVLSVGGSVEVMQNGRKVSVEEKLPDGPFVVIRIDIYGWHSKFNHLVIDNEIARFSGLRELQVLSITSLPLTDRGLTHLKGLPNLWSLWIDDTQVTEDCVATLQTLPKLTSLSVKRTGIAPAFLPKLQERSKVTYLSVSWPFSPQAANLLLEQPQLNSLALDQSWLTEEAVAVLRQKPLRELVIVVDGNLSDERLQLLSGFPQLELFEIYSEQGSQSNSGITPTGLRSLTALPELHRLIVKHLPLNDEHLLAMSELKGLENLILYHSPYDGHRSTYTDAGLEHLSRLPKLKELTVLRSDVTPVGLARFRTAKPECQITTDVVEKQPLAFETPGFDQWVKEVSALAPEQQVEAVAKKLGELNPRFDGKVTHQIADGVVTHLKFFTDDVTDVSPVRALPGLWNLDLSSNRLNGRFADLSPLNGLPLTSLSFNNTNVRDLSSLQGMPLVALGCELTHITDLSALAGMQLTFFDCYRTPVSDISVLKGMPLTTLLTQLTQVTDYSPLQGMPLDTLICDFHPKRDTELLRSITKLTAINGQPAADFWRDVAEYSDASKTLVDPAFQQWLKDVAPLTAEEQVVAVAKKLQELNPSFDGKVEHTIEAGVVSSLKFVSDKVWNIAPVRALSGLKTFDCSGSKLNGRDGKVADLSPLTGLPLTDLKCVGTLVIDLTPLRGMPLTKLDYGSGPGFDMTPLQGMPLTWLNFSLTPLSDLTPIRGLPLTYLQIDGAHTRDLSSVRGMPLIQLSIREVPVSDLTPLAGMQLDFLGCQSSNVTDLTQIKDMPIKYLWLDFQPARDTALLRSMPTLEYINDKPVAEFWKEVEAGGK